MGLWAGCICSVGQTMAAPLGIVRFSDCRESLKLRSATVLAPTYVGEMLQSLGGRFGAGYAQRVTEAANTYRAQNYLSTCTMAGAAAESLLLATAIAKREDEAGVLETYNGRSGRLEVARLVLAANLSSSIGDQFEAALNVLHYWRDNAGRGTATTISEDERRMPALTQLLRLTRFTSNHWDVLKL